LLLHLFCASLPQQANKLVHNIDFHISSHLLECTCNWSQRMHSLLPYLLCFNVNCAFAVRAFNVEQKPYVLNTNDFKLGVPDNKEKASKMMTQLQNWKLSQNYKYYSFKQFCNSRLVILLFFNILSAVIKRESVIRTECWKVWMSAPAAINLKNTLL